MPESAAFTCRRCGHCCLGEGGIVLGNRDIDRLRRHLSLDRETFLDRYAEQVGGKPRLVSQENGYCIFYRDGCGIHPARPDVCRAWPFFKGNLIDAASHAMAADDCPGINPQASHREFARQGRAYLNDHGLGQARGEGVPEALADIPEEEPEETDHARPSLDASQ